MEGGENPVTILLIHTKYSVTVNIGMVRVSEYHRQNLKNNIIKTSEMLDCPCRFIVLICHIYIDALNTRKHFDNICK